VTGSGLGKGELILDYQIVDAHCDTVGLFGSENSKYDFTRRNESGHLDLPRMREGGIKLQFFALYIKEEYTRIGALRYCLQLLDSYYETMQRCRDDLQTVYSTADLQEALKGPKTAALLSVEGGEALEGELAVLRMLFRLGVRSLGLTWNHPNQLASGVGEGVQGDGLKVFGRQVIREMNRLGMVIDLAHINEAGFREALAESRAPVIVSHANARAICDHPRNLSDDQLRRLRDCGGVIGLTFYPEFVASQNATIDNLLDHFVHVAAVAGTDHLGFGSDFDGIEQVLEGLEDVTGMPRLVEELRRRGFSAADIEKITSRNFIRVLEKVLPAGPGS
jgi:membrane dipeptidase